MPIERNRAKGHIAIEARADGLTDGVFGFVPGPGESEAPEPPQRVLRQEAILSRLDGEVGYLGAGSPRVEIRFLRHRKGKPVRVAVLAAISTEDPSAVPTVAARYREELAVLLRDLAPGLDWRPVTSKSELERLRAPFDIGAAAVLRLDPDGPNTWGPVAPEAITETAALVPHAFMIAISLSVTRRMAPFDAGSAVASLKPGARVALAGHSGDDAVPPRTQFAAAWALEGRIAITAPKELPGALMSAIGAEVRGHGRWSLAGRRSGDVPLARAEFEVALGSAFTLSNVADATRSIDLPWPGRSREKSLAATGLDLVNGGALFALPVADPSRSSDDYLWPQRLTEVPRSVPGTGLRLGRSIGARRRWAAISALDLQKHLWVIGSTGSGKSTLVENIVRQALETRDIALIAMDAHGALLSRIAGLIPQDRVADTVVFDPSDHRRPVTFNPMYAARPEDWPFLVSSLIGLLYEMFDPHRQGIVGPRFEHAVRNAMLTVLETPGSTLVDVVSVLIDPEAVHRFLENVTDPVVRDYWAKQIAQTSDFHRSEVLDYIVSKFGRFITDRSVRAIIDHAQGSLDFGAIMRDGGIALLDLNKAMNGAETAMFLGHMLLPAILAAAMRRGAEGVTRERLRPVLLVVDEFQNFANPALSAILSEGRKFQLTGVLSHQNAGQLPRSLLESLLGNVGNLAAFRVGVIDRPVMVEALGGDERLGRQLTTLPNYHAVVRLLADGQPQPPFAIKGEPPAADWSEARVQVVREASRERYGVEYEGGGPRSLELEMHGGRSERSGERPV